ncbi:MAG TPA: ergothioneine biosynthesis protein EgtC [Acidimicrobiia bacterium]|nr:ergothioneine biosynthesis protein EgtC [Acidimicrobiia bacterium]
MCRHLAYLGRPVALTELLCDAPHSLVEQARHPRHQTSGTANPDGYGVAWYDQPGRPRRYRSTTPIWADVDLPALAGPVSAPAVLAAARLASPGAPVEATGNAPFVAGRHAFSLNGIVDGWQDGAGAALRASVSPRRRGDIVGVTDAEALFAIALDHLDRGAAPADALAAVVHTVETRTTGRLNLLLTDGVTVAATACGNSLFACHRPNGTLIASEPLDDDEGWSRVPDRTVVVATSETLTSAPL